MILAALLAVAVAGPVGWRLDGTGAWPVTTAPERWDASSLAWSVPLPDFSNASPVLMGGLVCACIEPVSVVCVDAATGAERWRASHPVVDALPVERRAAVAAEAAEGDALEAQLTGLRTAYSTLQRDARRAGVTVDAEALQAIVARMETVRARLAEVDRWRTPPTQGLVGWSAPTPVATDDRLYVLFGNGVVAAHRADGGVLWRRWLGERPVDMIGYDGGGHSAARCSPATCWWCPTAT